MPRPLASGRPGSAAIPPTWAPAHRPWAAGTMNGSCTLLDPAAVTETWDEATEQMVSVPDAGYWSGPCRVKVLSAQARESVTVGDRETTVDVLVTLPNVDVFGADYADVIPGHAVVLDEVDDPALLGARLRVVQLGGGTERIERDLFCTRTI